MAKDPFNFFPNEDWEKHPNYRVEYETKKGVPSVSNPAIFSSDGDAIEVALKESPSWKEIGMNIVKVLKYEKDGLKEIFRKAV